MIGSVFVWDDLVRGDWSIFATGFGILTVLLIALEA